MDEYCNELWKNLSDYTRDFQIIINFPKQKKDEMSSYFIKRILKKKDGKFEIYYVDNQNRVSKELDGEDEEYYEDNKDNKKYLDIDPAIFDKNFCDEGSGEDYSILLTEDEKRLVYSELNSLYGIRYSKEMCIELLDKLNIR